MLHSKIDLRVINIVVTATLNKDIDLGALSKLFPEYVEYNPRKYFAAYFKIPNMKGKVSVFKSGRLISVGTRSVKDSIRDLRIVEEKLSEKELGKLKGRPKVENIVLLADLKRRVDIEKLVFQLTDVIYEPDIFPALITHFQTIALLIFSSGKVICTGLRSMREIKLVKEFLEKALVEFLK